MSEPKRIKTVIAFPNGMVAVCDQFGEQMPEYQGERNEMLPKIMAAVNEDTEFLGMDND